VSGNRDRTRLAITDCLSIPAVGWNDTGPSAVEKDMILARLLALNQEHSAAEVAD
jgi:hypothetical protein